MAKPLQTLCLKSRVSHCSTILQTCIPRCTTQTRLFTLTHRQYRPQKKEEEEEIVKIAHYEKKKDKPTPLKPSQIDAPRATSSRQLLETFSIEEDEIDKIINEKEGDEYQLLLEQYSAAISPERPPDYDAFMRKNGLDSSRQIDPSNESQMATRMRDQEKRIQTASRFLDSQNPVSVNIRRERPGFVYSGDDEKMNPVTLSDETFEADDITPMGHGYLEQHRDIREYYRLAAWELPLLSQYAKAFSAPTKETPLRFRYTSYLGEQHPSEKKVVVEFCVADIPLEPKQRRKLVKLLGPRYNPQKDLAKMSCESFPEPAQNKRYLSDLIDDLLGEARLESTADGGKDAFEDIPADFRHVKWKKEPKFPDAWKMTPQRREKLFQGWTAEVGRSQQAILEDTNVDGVKTISHYLGAQPKVAVPQTVKVR